jgi:hypothetical protein
MAVGGVGGGGGARAGGGSRGGGARAGGSKGGAKSGGAKAAGKSGKVGGKSNAGAGKKAASATKPPAERKPATAQQQQESRKSARAAETQAKNRVDAQSKQQATQQADQKKAEASSKNDKLGAQYADKQKGTLTQKGAQEAVTRADNRVTEAQKNLEKLQTEKNSLKQQTLEKLGLNDGKTLDSQIKTAKETLAGARDNLTRAQGDLAASQSAANFNNQPVQPGPNVQNNNFGAPPVAVDRGPALEGGVKLGNTEFGARLDGSGLTPFVNPTQSADIARLGPLQLEGQLSAPNGNPTAGLNLTSPLGGVGASIDSNGNMGTAVSPPALELGIGGGGLALFGRLSRGL